MFIKEIGQCNRGGKRRRWLTVNPETRLIEVCIDPFGKWNIRFTPRADAVFFPWLSRSRKVTYVPIGVRGVRLYSRALRSIGDPENPKTTGVSSDRTMARHRVKQSFISEEAVDLTPLIDCVFLLLIFFMVTTVFIHARGLDVDLPRASQATEQQEKKDINIIVERDGRIEIGGEEVPPGELRARIERAMVENRNDNVIIQGDRDVAQSRVVEVVDAAKGVGVKGIAFAKLQGT